MRVSSNELFSTLKNLSENLVLSWAGRVVGDDCLEIHVLLMFF